MASSFSSMAFSLFVIAMLLQTCLATRRLTSLVQDPPITMEYHKGALLTGRIALNLVWYGNFSAPQRAVLTDFLSSLATPTSPQPEPSVATWFNTARKYYAATSNSKARFPTLSVSSAHVLDASYTLGRRLRETDLLRLAARGGRRRAINVVLTAHDVAVDGFCSSRCGSHGASPRSRAGRFAYVWVGNPATQCAGQCAWPYHQPQYGPQTAPLAPPNGDVGVDGMVVSLASRAAHQPVRQRLLPGPRRGAARGRHRLRRCLRQGGLPRVRRLAARGSGHRRQLQRQRSSWAEVPGPRPRRPGHLRLLHSGVG